MVGEEALTERRTEVDTLIIALESGKGLSAKSIAELTNEIGTLEKLAANDRIQRGLIQQLQKRISENSQETQRLQKVIVSSESETIKRQEKLRGDRLDAYKKMFSLWKEEQKNP